MRRKGDVRREGEQNGGGAEEVRAGEYAPVARVCACVGGRGGVLGLSAA